MKKLLVLTSGGDAPGMNAAIRAVVRSGCYFGCEVFGSYGGYQGLVEQKIVPLRPADAANIIQRGGTMLKTDRCEAFYQKSTRAHCIDFLKRQGIDGLIVIGGDGSFRGAALLHEEGGIRAIGIPATIDNDIEGTEYTIGFNTASQTALASIDKIRDTAGSHDRHFLVEVMGRSAGFLALDVGLAGGAELILTPEFPLAPETISRMLADGKRKKMSQIIIVAEASSKPGRSIKIAEALQRISGLEFKVCILGHTQRGGSPTVRDRNTASEMGYLAVTTLRAGKSNLMIAENRGRLMPVPFPSPDAPSRRLTNDDLLKTSRILSS